MTGYLLQRCASALFVLWALTVVTFTLANLTPGDPARMALEARGMEPTEQSVAQMRRELQLEEPAPVRYLAWLGRVVRGDLGHSFRNGEPVAGELATRLPATLALALAALAASIAIALPLGVLAATRPGSRLDHICRGLALAGAAVPSFWLALMLIVALAVWLQLLPTSGSGSAAHLVLPTLSLAAGQAAMTLRLVRSGLLEALPQAYVSAARARGLLEHRVVLAHALPNALLPVVTVLGMQIGSLLGGAAIVETIFAWPGVGRLAVEAIYGRDYPMIQGFVLLTGSLVVVLNLATDLCYGLLDPRIRLGAARA